jgi:hypothetical protein
MILGAIIGEKGPILCQLLDLKSTVRPGCELADHLDAAQTIGVSPEKRHLHS